MEIISGLGFDKFAPKVISIEQNDIFSMAVVLETPVAPYLDNKSNTAIAKNILLRNISTVFYIQKHLNDEKVNTL